MPNDKDVAAIAPNPDPWVCVSCGTPVDEDDRRPCVCSSDGIVFRRSAPNESRVVARSYARGANGQRVELMKIGGRKVEVDAEIAPIVWALNEAGVQTVASCSGHGHRPGNIMLLDGREIIIARDFAEARKIDRLFPLDINGETMRAHLQAEKGRP